MCKLREKCLRITTDRRFELGITAIILLNSFLIGVETYTENSTIRAIQSSILGIFTIEIILRYIASGGNKAFFDDGWNIFDLSLVLISYIPETLFANAATMTAIRVIRVFRVLRLLRAAKEIKVIITVLIKSMTAMFYNVILLGIFIYLYAIIGVGLFKMPNPEKMTQQERVRFEKYMEEVPNSPENSPDPFGTLGEVMFTLFRELTGEGWSDLRYNHISAYENGYIKATPAVITAYHISWLVLASFLLLNLVTGAILNNYQIVMDHSDDKEKK